MYTIINDKKWIIIPYNTFKNKLFGLILKKEIIDKIYLFENCRSIHTFFMRQNIDVCFLDKNYKVVFLRENVGKNKIVIGKGYYTLEMPVGVASYLKVGDIIKIKK